MYGEVKTKKKVLDCGTIRKTVLAWTLVIPRTRIRMEMVRIKHVQTKRRMNDVAENMMLNLSETGHPVFRGTSALERGTLQSNGGGKLPFHVCGVCETVEVMFRPYFRQSAQCVHGAAADLCEELASSISDFPTNTRRPVAQEKPDTMVSPTDSVPMTKPTSDQGPSTGRLAARTQAEN